MTIKGLSTFPKFQTLTLTTRCSLVSYPRHYVYAYASMLIYIYIYIYIYIAQSAGAVEYTDCTSAEG